MTDWNDEYKAKVREFIAKNGSRVNVVGRYYDWEDDDEVSTYGWTDWEANKHVIKNCYWIVPEGAILYERSYSQFTDTFHDNENEVGVNVRGCFCACGKYENVILRWTGSLTEMLHFILGMPDIRNEVIL